MSIKIQVIFYSMYGHIWKMAEAVAAGAREVPDAEVALLQVPELVPEEALERTGAAAARQAFAHVPVAQPARQLSIGRRSWRRATRTPGRPPAV